MNNITDILKEIQNVNIPENYENLHDLNFLLKLNEIGKFAKNNLETAKQKTIESQLKTFDEVLEYIPNDQLDDYKICPNYYNNIVDTIYNKRIGHTFYNEKELDKAHELKDYLEAFKNENILSSNVYYGNVGSLHGFFAYSVYIDIDIDTNFIFYDKLKTVNKFFDKFLVDTNNKEIHVYFNDDNLTKISEIHNYTFDKTKTYINDNNQLCYLNTIKYLHKFEPTSGPYYHREEILTDEIMYIENIFDIENNTFLHTKIATTKINNKINHLSDDDKPNFIIELENNVNKIVNE